MSVPDLADATRQRDDAEDNLTAAVIAARTEGLSWSWIGKQMGVSAQAAHQKYRRVCEEHVDA